MKNRKHLKKQGFVQVFRDLTPECDDLRSGGRLRIAYGLAVHLDRRQAGSRPITAARLAKESLWPQSTCRAALAQMRERAWIDDGGHLLLRPEQLDSQAHLQVDWALIRTHRHHPHDAVALQALKQAAADRRDPTWYLAAGSWLANRLRCSVRSAQRTVERLAARGLVQVRQFVLGAVTRLRPVRRRVKQRSQAAQRQQQQRAGQPPHTPYGVLGRTETAAEVERAIAAMLTDTPPAPAT